MTVIGHPELVSGSLENYILRAAIAQLVEQGTENPCVLGSIPSCGTIFLSKSLRILKSLVPSRKTILNRFARQSELRHHFFVKILADFEVLGSLSQNDTKSFCSAE